MLVVAGGSTDDMSTALDTVFFYRPTEVDNPWQQGPNMPMKLKQTIAIPYTSSRVYNFISYIAFFTQESWEKK